jgi:DNA-binding LytR/AlgR family response regulator
MKCIIIEDEIPAQRIIENYLKKVPFMQLEGVFNSAVLGNQYLAKNEVDLLFLDINLPDISGLDFVKTIKNPPAVIITTAYPDYALSSFELDTIIDYLVKPISFERFYKAISKANRLFNKPEKTSDNSVTLYLNVDKTLHKIELNNILYVESDRNYITVVTENKKFTFIDTLKNWIEKLEGKSFIQVHKSFIINSKKIDKLSGNGVFVRNQKIPIGRTYKQILLQKLNIA